MECPSEVNAFDFVRFTVTDVNGVSRTKTLTQRQAEKCMKEGMDIYFNILGFSHRSKQTPFSEKEFNQFGNILQIPDPSTLLHLPWATGGKYKVGEVYCDVHKDGKPLEGGPRVLLKTQLSKLTDQGSKLRSSYEIEFYILNANDMKPICEGVDTYASLGMSPNEELLLDIITYIDQVGAQVELIHREYGPGQFEINLTPQDGVTGIDRIARIKDAIKEICQLKGYKATFMTQPGILEGNASGFHFNHSLIDIKTGKNMMSSMNKEGQFEASEMMRHWAGGLQKHAKALTALCSPTVNCYRRVHQEWSPTKADWGFDDRLATFRLKTKNHAETYIENRLPSSACNPYIVAAATIAAGLDGLKNKIDLPPPMDVKAESLPHTLEEALDDLVQDEVLQDALGKSFMTFFLHLKRNLELTELKASVMPDVGQVGGEMIGIDKEREIYLDFA